MSEFPVPTATAKRMPPGVIYLLAGPLGHPPPWASLWAFSTGRERLVTPGQAGRQIEGFGASRAGIIVSNGANLAAGLARWTRRGPVFLHPADHPSWNITGLVPDVSRGGVIAYALLPPGSATPTMWMRPSWTGRDRIVYRWQNGQGLDLAVFGPRGMLAVMLVGQRVPRHKAGLVILDRRGTVVRKFKTAGFGRLYGGVWGAQAPALVLRSIAGRGEVQFLSGRRELLPAGWKPLAWNPGGRQLLIASSTHLGIWALARPGHVSVIGTISRGYGIWQAEWLSGPAKT
jgi:hypothetical protein